MTTPRHHSLLIIGAGMTGLSTALACRKACPDAAHPVLVVEKQPCPGGCVTTFARKGYRFDTVQLLPDITDLLDFYGISFPLHRFSPNLARLFLVKDPAKEPVVIPVAASQDDFLTFLCQRFPAELRRLNRFFKYCASLQKQLGFLKTEPGLGDIPGILLRCPKILAQSNRTYSQFLHSFGFRDPELLDILDLFSSFAGIPANRGAALLAACAMTSSLRGSFRPQQGFITFGAALARKARELGVVLRYNCEVRRIIIEKGTAIGVELTTGEIITADTVVSTTDTQQCCASLVGYNRLSAAGSGYARKARQAVMSPSGFAIHLGLDESVNLHEAGFDCGYNLLTTGGSTFGAMFDAWEQGGLVQSPDHFHLAVTSPSCVIGGKPTLVILVYPAPAPPWIRLRSQNYQEYCRQKSQAATFYIDLVERYLLPGLKEKIRLTDVATPATYSRYLGSPGGSHFDMLAVPANFGKSRLPSRTPVRNLFIPKFSHGIWPSLQAGLQVADMLCNGAIMHGAASYQRPADTM